MKVKLSISARNLSNVAGRGKGVSDPFAVVTKLAEFGNNPECMGRTEVMKNTLHPDWTKVFVFDYELGRPVKFAVSLYDEVRKGPNKYMGSAVFELGRLLGARGGIRARTLKGGGGTGVAQAEKYTGGGRTLHLSLRGIGLKNTEGPFNKSDPFYEIKRQIEGPGGIIWDVIYRSTHIKDNLHPIWPNAVIDLAVLCNGKLDQPIQMSVMDHEKTGKHVHMGDIETTVRGLIAAKDSGPFVLKRRGKSKGELEVSAAEIMGDSSSNSDRDLASQTAKVLLSAPPPPLPEPLSDPPSPPPTAELPSPATNPTYVPSASPSVVPYVPGAADIPSPPTFLDYISGGCQIHLCVAIDFTGSNGDPRQPGTLHYRSPDGSPNDYEMAVMAIGDILDGYSCHHKFPVLGFGAKYGGEVRHCFQVGNASQVEGIDGIREAYRETFRTGLTMSGPTVFADVIRAAASMAVNSQETANAKGEQAYGVLLIITDGEVTDRDATAACLDEISDCPLSVVIVGVGETDFTSMHFLDDCSGPGKPNITQFVEFNRHKHDALSLTAATLDEIPSQLVNYFTRKGIPPGKEIHLDEEEILVPPEEEEEIDLALKFGDDGKIMIESGGVRRSTVWI